MRRSQTVAAPILASAAVALLTACRSTQPERCVDETGKVVDPKFCQGLPDGSTNTRNSGDYVNGVFIPHTYRYYYGYGGGFGSYVSGGSYTPSAGTSYSVSSGTSRGGFGSSFSGSGGDAGGGE